MDNPRDHLPPVAPYVDEDLEDLLRKIKELDLAQMTALMDSLSKKYLEAEQNYQTTKSQLDLEIRNYYVLRIFEFFKNIFRVLCFLTPDNEVKNALELKKAKREDIETIIANYEKDIKTSTGTIKDRKETINKLQQTISEKEKELITLKRLIEDTDTPNNLANQTIKNQLDTFITDRNKLSEEISKLYKEVDSHIQAAATVAEIEVSAPNTAKETLIKRRQIQPIKSKSTHIVATKLTDFLNYQTTTRLAALRKAITDNPSYQDDRQLSDDLWEAGALHPQITAGLNREKALLHYLTSKLDELNQLTSVIEDCDVQLQIKKQQSIVTQMESSITKKNQLMDNIHQLLDSNADLLSHAKNELTPQQNSEIKLIENKPILKALQDSCAKITHPVATKVSYFLRHQTNAAMKALKELIKNDDSYQESKELSDIIFKLGDFYPEITKGLTRDIELPAIKEIEQSVLEETMQQHAIFESILEDLNDQENDLINDVIKLKANLDEEAIRFNGLTKDPAPLGNYYVSREKLKKYQYIAGALHSLEKIKTIKNEIRTKELEQDTIKKHIKTYEEEQKKLTIKPVLFNQEVLTRLQEKCKQVLNSDRKNPVLIALEHFVQYRTLRLLGKLKIAMNEHPTYLKDKKIAPLIAETDAYFPYLTKESQKSAAISAHSMFKPVYDNTTKKDNTRRPSPQD